MKHFLFKRPSFDAGRHHTVSFRVLFICVLTLVSITTSLAVIRNGTNTGAIADGGATNPTCGVPRDVNFAVSNQSTPIGSVSVSFTATHTFVGDLQVRPPARHICCFHTSAVCHR